MRRGVMWKVKRMRTARILDLAIAIGAGCLAARPARGPDGSLDRAAPAFLFSAPDAFTRIPADPSLAVTQR